ncbi:hypothetical protein MWH28_04720 [Natroniella sulfidigena]|uniref:hypothetical protein n=1 Tax=Natroniella sulfidigena TaxID=723921 RepID=UPI00200A1FBA|nr:hypothetical protein [Natroniella sulfidigena]MCK8816674.1 hypothetical protein [Natroniella sulfidigena]
MKRRYGRDCYMIKRAYIDLEVCSQSDDCSARQHCAKEAINFEDGKIYINQYCNGCGKCIKHCSNRAIKLV